MNNLLIDTQQLKTIVLVAVGVLCALACLFGILRKFSRMSWLGWQTALLFAATLAVPYLQKIESVPVVFGAAAGGLIVLTALVFLIGALVRKPFLGMEGGGMGGRVFNRLLGGLTGVLNVFVFFAVFGGLALACVEPFGVAQLENVYTHALWQNFFGAHAFDLFFVFAFAGILRWGYRTGFLRMIVTITVLTLMLIAVFLAMYMTLHVSFLSQLSNSIAGAIKINEIAAGWIGFGITSFIVAFVFMLVIIFIAWVLNLLLRLAGKSRAFSAFDSVLFALITCVLLVGWIVAFDFGVEYALRAVQSNESLAQIAPYVEKVKEVFTASPLSAVFYEYNPLLLVIN